MQQTTIQLSAKTRSTTGTGAARRMRRTGWIPAVLCADKSVSHTIQVNYHEFTMMLRKHHGENLIIDLVVEGMGTRKVLMREVQRHPVREDYRHVDFQEISMTRKMRVAIPLEFIGEPVGVSQEGGVFERVVREIEVECLLSDLVDSIPVDVAQLALGHRLLVRDLKIDPKLTVITAPDIAIAIVSAPRQEEEVAAPTEEAAGEPEVIGKKKEGEEEGEAAEGDEKAKGKEKAPAEKGKEKASAEKGKEKAPAEKGKEKAPAEKGKEGADKEKKKK